MKKVNEVSVYVRPEVEEVNVDLSTVLCESGGATIGGEGSNPVEEI